MPNTLFSGLLLDEQLPDGRISGKVYIENESIVFENSEIKKSLPVRLLKIENGGTANRHIYFKTNQDTFTICATDSAILKHSVFNLNQSHKLAIKKVHSHKKRMYIGVTFVVLLVSIPIFSILFFKKEIIKSIAKKVPSSAEQTVGEQYIKQISMTEKLDSVSPAALELRQKAKLISAQTEGHQTFNVYISNSNEVNAYALTGGYVVFNKGLLKKSKSWEEVLGVMSHEMAHVTQKHHARGVISQIGWTTVLSFFLGDGGAFTDLIFSSAANLESLSYSRDFETESDEKGLEYLVKANIRPTGLVSFFETLQKESGVSKHIPELLSTHPASDNRAENLESKIKALAPKQYINLGDYRKFVQKL